MEAILEVVCSKCDHNQKIKITALAGERIALSDEIETKMSGIYCNVDMPDSMSVSCVCGSEIRVEL